ncbi:hypothetical protein ACSS6W_001943 [Trichoderma asperelloides]
MSIPAFLSLTFQCDDVDNERKNKSENKERVHIFEQSHILAMQTQHRPMVS